MLKIPTIRKTYVVLKHFEHTYAALKLLTELQQMVPNLPLEVEPDQNRMHLKQFINIGYLEFSDMKLIRALNP
jgi:hypothetical protein